MDLHRLPNRELIQRLTDAGPDDPLWPEFLKRFRGRIRLAVFRAYQTEALRTPSADSWSASDAVDDLTQEVFIRLLDSDRRALSRFEGKSEHSAFTYLSTIAINLVRDHFKALRAAKKPKGITSLSDSGSTGEGEGRTHEPVASSGRVEAERFVASSELRRRVREALDELSPKPETSARDRLVFQLFFVEGLTVDEVAAYQSVGLSPSGVEKCIRRIRGALRKKLDAE